MSTTKLMTIEEAEARRDTVWDYELVRGEFRPVMPSGGEHSAVGATMTIILGAYVRANQIGRMYSSDAGFILARDPDTLLSPDVAFVQADRVPPLPTHRGFLPLAPDLAVEVIAPSTVRRELDEKVEIYLHSGVRMVLVVDPDARSCTVRRPGREPMVIAADGEFDGDDVLPGFRIPIAEFFE